MRNHGSVSCICVRCGAEFHRSPSKIGLYCSVACKVKPPSAICLRCGVTFHRAPSASGPYCSRACWDNRATLEERFWAKVNKDGPVPAACPELGPCWLWLASADPEGYGFFYVGRLHGRATRYSYALAYGPIPAGLWVCHRCDNPPCVRPEHLFLGSQTENMRDMIAKRRKAMGSKNGHAKLTDDRVREIRRLIADGLADTAIGERFRVSRPTIGYIRRGEIWQHVS